jgi:hypothetical protein
MLAKIPLIPALLETVEEDVTGMAMALASDSKKTSFQEGGEVTVSVREGDQQVDDKGGEGDPYQQVQQNDEQLTLLQWISANNQSNVYQVAQFCIKNLEQVCTLTTEYITECRFV